MVAERIPDEAERRTEIRQILGQGALARLPRRVRRGARRRVGLMIPRQFYRAVARDGRLLAGYVAADMEEAAEMAAADGHDVIGVSDDQTMVVADPAGGQDDEGDGR